MLKKIFRTFDILSLPLLYYVESGEHSVFRNYLLFKNTGIRTKKILQKHDVGKLLEYKIDLDKKYKIVNILVLILSYFLYLSIGVYRLGIYFSIAIAICGLYFSLQYFEKIYRQFLQNNIQDLQLTEFRPDIAPTKMNEFRSLFLQKIALVVIIVALYLSGMLLLTNLMKKNIQNKNFTSTLKIGNFYEKIYPKTELFYDLRGIARYAQKDYKGALADYKFLLGLSGKKFISQDIPRLGNILIIQKKISGANDAIDVFNDYSTRKKLNILEQSKLLWMKSMFSLDNNIIHSVISDYDNLLESLNENDEQNRFYILCDKAYMLYLLRRYNNALEIYDENIDYALSKGEKYKNELKTLYAERAFTKLRLGDNAGAEKDFYSSKFPNDELNKYEPVINSGRFMSEY